ncbi:isochorismate synthase [Vibrio sp. vnigr-6D03]|uniref:isochorismate synthase n=1 Tax=Vibrio sp. vnigr-6D03 TaxID=2058088 RepID=UPI000C3388B5|nr:isochorismate synthase [Vibrio sp. vnigr-6D03]PKF78369.1 isochorismate synthase [Vibrio sp. vnigr-6D03]
MKQSEIALLPLQAKINELIECVYQGKEHQHRISLPIELDSSFSLLDWLEHQPHSPKLYWKSRGGNIEAATLGQVSQFRSTIDAQVGLKPKQNIWVVSNFAEHERYSVNTKTNTNIKPESYCFLPQIELIRNDNDWTLSVNLSSDISSTLNALASLSAGCSSVSRQVPLPELTFVEHQPTAKIWDELVVRALTQFQSSALKKVVLARQTTFEQTHTFSPFAFVHLSQIKNEGSYHFAFAIDEEIAFVGSTPERLYKRVGLELETEALAGTVGRGSSSEQDLSLSTWLLNDPKNQRENQLVVEDIVGRLAPLCSQIQIQQSPSIKKLSKVQHLRRVIKAEISKKTSGESILSVLQPTAAIAGRPREEALDFIQKYEPINREWYSGNVGFFNREEAEFCVAIRSAKITAKHIHFYAGAGIVPGSESDREWQELDKKMSTLLSLFSTLPEVEVAS